MKWHRYILWVAIMTQCVLAIAQAQKANKTFTYNLHEEYEKLEKEAANRFFFRTPKDKNGLTIALHNAERPPVCNGDLLARSYRLIMNDIEVVQDICWKRDNNSSDIILTDPKAIIFKTKKIDASSLIYIKSSLDISHEESKKRIDETMRRAENVERRKIDCIAIYPIITCE